MALRLYQFGLFATFILSLFLWLVLVFSVNPTEAPFWIIALFYITFFLIWLSVFAYLGYYMKVWSSNREVLFSHIGPTLRQASFVSAIITGCIFLEQVKVLNWWVAGMFIVAIGLLELYFRSKK